MAKGNVETQNSSQQSLTQGQSQTTPWAQTSGLLSGILGNIASNPTGLNPAETNAINALSSGGGNPNAGLISSLGGQLLSGQGAPDRTGIVNDAYANYQKELQPYLDPKFLDPRSTPGFGDALATSTNDITNNINGSFAAAGRDFSGLNQQTLARGLSQGQGALISDQYNKNVAAQRGAQDSLFGAGGATAGLLSGLDQTALGNRLAGIDVSNAGVAAANSGPMQTLQAEALRRGIPMDALLSQLGAVLPASQAFGNTTSSQSGQQTGQATKETQVSPLNQAIGLGLGAAGLFGGAGGGSLLSSLGGGLFGKATNNFLGSGSFKGVA